MSSSIAALDAPAPPSGRRRAPARRSGPSGAHRRSSSSGPGGAGVRRRGRRRGAPASAPDAGRHAFAPRGRAATSRAMHAAAQPGARGAGRPLRASTRAYRGRPCTATTARIAARPPRTRRRRRLRRPGVRRARASSATSTARCAVPVVDEGDRAGVDWSRAMVFPGLRGGERLRAHDHACRRAATLQARDGTPIAEGDDARDRARPRRRRASRAQRRAGAARARRDLAAHGVPAGRAGRG